jgi:hypothetical protein
LSTLLPRFGFIDYDSGPMNDEQRRFDHQEEYGRHHGVASQPGGQRNPEVQDRRDLVQ